ncbi:MAG: hypothetical protein ACI845_003482, partial [Gammaproteobacteria bacterium]
PKHQLLSGFSYSDLSSSKASSNIAKTSGSIDCQISLDYATRKYLSKNGYRSPFFLRVPEFNLSLSG